MTVYTNSALSTSVIWPNPIETIWQVLPGCGQSSPGWKRTDLGLSERLFIGAVLNLPQDRRCWGIITWLAGMLNVSRPTLYAIGAWAKAGLLSKPVLPTITVNRLEERASSDDEQIILVSPNRLKRMALTLVLPGGVSGRSVEACL
jgi:hypothetical protein